MTLTPDCCERMPPDRIAAKPHPAALIFLWACFTAALQSLHAAALLLAGTPLLLAACALSSSRLFTLLRRTRWIMLSLLVIYAWATPGGGVWEGIAEFSPTWEGLAEGLLQLARLVFALAGLSILLGLLTQQQLIGGLYALARPLCYLGVSRERLAVRLALTLHYAETAMLDTSTNWRGEIGKMLASPTGAQHEVELHVIPFTLRDGLLIAASCALLVLVLL